MNKHQQKAALGGMQSVEPGEFPSGFLAFGEAKCHRLVEAAKSPTDIYRLASGPFSDLLGRDFKEQLTDSHREQFSAETGTKTFIQFREWSDEWRIRTQVDGTVGSPPPEQSGNRISDMLSDRGARKIADSCAYMAEKHGGFKTFVTGTFDEATRAKLTTYDIKTRRPLTTIQKEVTRTMDAMQKMYQRGWTTDKSNRVDSHEQALAYCWVVEVPENDAGIPNPHVHMLLDWQVDYQHFKPWAARIESIWGNGYFHLEKIEDPLCAGAYMAKAAGYISKANGQSDQGIVTGNRYAISKRARAPEWYTIGTFELGVMGHLIRDVYDHITTKHEAIFAERKRLNQARDNIIQRAKKEKEKTGRYPLWAKNQRDKIGKRLAYVRHKINSLEVRANKYQLVLKGQSAFNRFSGWAMAQGWKFNERPDSHWLAEFKQRLYSKKKKRTAVTDGWLVSMVDGLRSRVRESVAACYELFDNDGWTFIDREDWRADYGF